MANWKLTLTYDGTPFHGWQVQPGLPTIQGALQAAIAQVTGETVLPQGSGRTDTGVHALGQVVSFCLTAAIPAENLHRALNRALPPSIRVVSTEPASDTFHARHHALRKTYEYRIFERRPSERRPSERRPSERRPSDRRPSERGFHPAGASVPDERACSPFLAPFVWDCRWPLDLEPMQQAAASLLGTHDFTSFSATDPDLSERDQDGGAPGRNPVKTIFASNWTSNWLHQHDLLVYRVTGSGFLHHMVRNIVGTLVDIGRGALPHDALPAILAARSRSAAGPTAPPQGLYLVEVEYPATDPSDPSPSPAGSQRATGSYV